MKTTPFQLIAGGGLGFLIMAIIGWNLVPVPRDESFGETAAAPGRRSERAPRHVRESSGITAAAKRELDVLRAARTPGERLRATVNLACSLPPSEFAAWLDGGWFNLREGADLTLFSKILMERWKKEDPGGLALRSMKNQTGDAASIFSSWAEKDPQLVLDFFKEHPDERMEMQALQAVAKKNPALALQRLQQMAAAGISSNVRDYSEAVLGELAKSAPAALEAALDSLPPKIKFQAESLLIAGKMKSAFVGELRKLWDRPDGLKIFENISGNDNSLRAGFFAELANLPAAWRGSVASESGNYMDGDSAVKWLDADLEGFGFTAKQAESIRSSAIGRMMYQHPEDALKRLGNIEMSASTKRNMIENLFQYVAGEPEKADGLMKLLATEEDRAAARAVLERPRGEEIAKIETPAAWFEKVSALGNEDSSYSYFSMIRDWDAEKLAALKAGFPALPDEAKRNIANNIARQGYSDRVPFEAEAIRYLVTNPQPVVAGDPNSRNDPLKLASNYIRKLAPQDPGAASEWVQTLPDGDAKYWAQKNLRTVWSEYDPKAADLWMKSLTPANRAAIEKLGK